MNERTKQALDHIEALLLADGAPLDNAGMTRLSYAASRLSTAIYREAEIRKEALKIASSQLGPNALATHVVQHAAAYAAFLDTGTFEGHDQ